MNDKPKGLKTAKGQNVPLSDGLENKLFRRIVDMGRLFWENWDLRFFLTSVATGCLLGYCLGVVGLYLR